MYVANVSVVFRSMLQVFYLAVASVLSWCCICCSGYIHMLQTYVSEYFICFRRMLIQVLHVAAVFISRHEKRAHVEAVSVCMRSNMTWIDAQQEAHTGVCSRSMWVCSKRGQVAADACYMQAVVACTLGRQATLATPIFYTYYKVVVFMWIHLIMMIGISKASLCPEKMTIGNWNHKVRALLPHLYIST
jgi:hypothetical protein